MPFLPPNQQRQSTEGTCSETWNTNRKSRLDDVAIAAIWVLCLVVIVSQQVCGFEYTSKLSRMFTDVSFCADITATFNEYLNESPDRALPHAVSLSILQVRAIYCITDAPGWLGSRVVSVLDSGAVGPRFKSQPRRCRVTVLGKLFTPIVPLFTKQQNW